MPKSKRNKQISLTNTKKRGLQLKQTLVEEVRSNLDSYARIFVFSVHNMRNNKLKDVRQQWKHSRFMFGKNKVMQKALGRKPEDEYKENLHLISKQLKGQCGLLFTNKHKGEVLKWFSNYAETDFARSGNVATDNVVLDKGPLPQFSHSLEPQLRQLGMPTSLQKGIVTLVKDFEVCKEKEILTPDKARILKLLGIEMSEFKFTIQSVWTCNDCSFEIINEDAFSEKENEHSENEKEDEDEDEEEKEEQEQKENREDVEMEADEKND